MNIKTIMNKDAPLNAEKEKDFLAEAIFRGRGLDKLADIGSKDALKALDPILWRRL